MHAYLIQSCSRRQRQWLRPMFLMFFLELFLTGQSQLIILYFTSSLRLYRVLTEITKTTHLRWAHFMLIHIRSFK